MLILGDIHGKTELIPNSKETIYQLGDLGIGFGKELALPSNFKFIRGNHDNPEECRSHPQYLGDYMILDRTLFISGAFSIDKKYRTAGVDWWWEEQLTYVQLDELMHFANHNRENIDYVVSHDCPWMIYDYLPYKPHALDLTSSTLQMVYRTVRPKKWVFGHHHRSLNVTIDGTEFIGLAEGELVEI